MASSSNIDFTKVCAGCELPSVVRCGNCWKGGKGRKVGYCSAAHQKMMWVSHKPYCRADESVEPVVFFQTPLSQSEFNQFISHVGTSQFDVAEFLDGFFLCTRKIIKIVVNARLAKISPAELWTDYNEMNDCRQDFEVHHDNFMIRHVMTMQANSFNQHRLVSPPLRQLYGLAVPPPLLQASAVWRKATSDYYFAMLNYDTVYTHGKAEELGPESAVAYASLWERVRIAVREMKSKGFNRFVPEIFEMQDSFLKQQVG